MIRSLHREFHLRPLSIDLYYNVIYQNGFAFSSSIFLKYIAIEKELFILSPTNNLRVDDI